MSTLMGCTSEVNHWSRAGSNPRLLDIDNIEYYYIIVNTIIIINSGFRSKHAYFRSSVLVQNSGEPLEKVITINIT